MGHRVELLQCMRFICQDTASELPPELGLRIARLAALEMTCKPEIVPEWQGTASELLVSLASNFGKIVLEELTQRFTPGNVPHYYVLKAFGDFASTNSFALVPALDEIMGRSVSLVSTRPFAHAFASHPLAAIPLPLPFTRWQPFPSSRAGRCPCWA
jgi:hypothetical protein